MSQHHIKIILVKNLSLFGAVVLALSCLSTALAQTSEGFRAASTNEIQLLYALCTNRPEKLHLVADIELTTPPKTREQIETSLSLENKLYQSEEAQLTDRKRRELVTVRSNLLARSMSGRHIQHVEEWYSGRYYRLDQTDEAVVSADYLRKNPAKYHDTFINLHDTNFFPYTSVWIDRELVEANVTQKPNKRFCPSGNLWQVLGMEEELTGPLIGLLADFPRKGSNSAPELNLEKSRKLIEGSLPGWHLQVREEKLGTEKVTRFELEGANPVIKASYWIGKSNGKPVCSQASLTNAASGLTFFSKRESFDASGLPQSYKTISQKNGTETVAKVTLKLMETHLDLTDKDIFVVQFPENGLISDMTSPCETIVIGSPFSARSAPVSRKRKMPIPWAYIGFGFLVTTVIVVFIQRK